MPNRPSVRAAALALALPGALGLAAPAAPAAAAEPTIESIMARDWVGTPPQHAYWSDDGRTIYYERRRPGSERSDLFRIEAGSGRVEPVAERDRGRAEGDGVWSRDRKWRAWVRDGDLFAKEAGRGAVRQLTRTTEVESDPGFLTAGRRLAFRRGDAFFAVDLDGGTLATLADLRFADDPALPAAGFLADRERRLFDAVRRRQGLAEEARVAAQETRAADPARPPAPWWLGKGKALLDAALSPSGERLVVVIGRRPASGIPGAEATEDGKPDSMPVWVTDSGYVEMRPVRPKVGTDQPETPAVLLLDLARHERRDLDLSALPGLADDPLAELKALARAAAEPKVKAPASGVAGPKAAAPAVAPPRPVEVRALAWNEEGTRLAVQVFSADQKDRWLALVDPASGQLTPLERQSDPAWLGWRFDEFGWMRDGATLWFLSEESGFAHLYLRALAGPRRALTGGPFEVDDPLLARDGKSFLVTANREQPGIEEVYRVDVASGEMTRLTALDGHAAALPSPDERQLLVTWSGIASPPELYLQPARPGAAARRLTRTVSPEFEAVGWTIPELVPVPSRHGAGEIWARLYKPPGWSAAGRYPAVLFLHGAGYLQDAHRGWSWYFREFMFHTLLARRGYVVLDLDYRASAGYGRAWRTAIYRQMGSPELDDLEDGVAWLAAEQAVDPARVGVYGGSYGGFLTLMALFKRPELFAAGAALRPVTDWAHYNQGYTSAILNTPEVDPEAYRVSSPIEFAAGLSKPLLLCHGMVDDNVVFQDSVRLVQRLIELGKTEWFETAIYPVEPHAFTEPSSWVDEYRRIWSLFERTLRP